MKLTRRDALALGLGATAASLLPFRASAAAEDAIAAFTGGAEAGSGGITLTAPQLARSGAAVPVSVEAPGAVAIALFATGNPAPGVATFTFGPLAGRRRVATRIRLSGSQEVVAVAKMENGSFTRISLPVTVAGRGAARQAR
ncbi:thiosulfate oxidation carrier protein SoxY [Celeribacter indicus]|uniref:Sulfur oxidation protein SoxY n=1 Tax=Celeribacter indicus TaxID=1208324 RepID=A0A0B5DT90_9RHOB|nr:thiosulfate oxidation carrier protein SoxY [Celeribacter indicus]AJE46269.1 sulfur oxidation protein SoxY [Celeribacter indicus]SDW51727.1 thiosulfate-binding protein SoxY [Celeribacter indicus]